MIHMPIYDLMHFDEKGFEMMISYGLIVVEHQIRMALVDARIPATVA